VRVKGLALPEKRLLSGGDATAPRSAQAAQRELRPLGRPGRFPGTGHNSADFLEFLRDPSAGLRLIRKGQNRECSPVITGRLFGTFRQFGRLVRQFL
jgi:hypothetical protein